MLIVNVASQCGYTDSNYRELQTLRTRHSEDKLAIIAFPCNQFGGQEPAPWSEIANFVKQAYGASFPVMGKVGDVICLRARFPSPSPANSSFSFVLRVHLVTITAAATTSSKQQFLLFNTLLQCEQRNILS